MAWLIALITGLFKAWLGKTPSVVPLAEEVGKDQEALRNVEAGEQAVVDARDASDASLAGSAVDPGSVRAPDPDSRD